MMDIPYLIMTLGLVAGFMALDAWATTCPPFVETYEGRYG